MHRSYPRLFFGGMSPDTPVTLIGDVTHHGTAAFVLFEDDDRDTLEWLVQQGRMRRELQLVRNNRRRFGDHLAGWVVGAGAAIAIVTDIVVNIYRTATGK